MLNTRAKIEVNGGPIKGELLEGRATAIVTTRGHGKAIPIDCFSLETQTPVGSVVDCNQCGPSFADLARNSDLSTLQKSVRGCVACEAVAINRQ